MSAAEMSKGQMVAIASAVALAASLFLAWGGAGGDVPDLPDGVPVPDGGIPTGDADLSGWESQNTLDIYLAIVAALVLGNAVMAWTGNPDGLPFAPAAATFLLGVIGTIMTVYVFIDLPDGLDAKIGLYLAIAAVVGITVGSYLQMSDEVAAADY